MARVSVENVVKRFGEVEVLHSVSLDIADKEFVVLVGPSGCGKTTLLRMIAGLESVSGGRLVIDDVTVNDMAPKDRDIAMVFQNYALYPHMTVAENMGFSMRIRGAAAEETRARVKAAAQILGLEALLDRRPAQLSGGQRQRVAMGRAIVRDPKVFLFDEPLSNLDAKLRVQMRAEIKALHQRLGTTIVYVTHDQIEAMTMADKIVVMRDGVVEQVGRPLDLYDNPTNLFVAGFLGSPAMNFFSGTFDAASDAIAVKGAGSLPLGGRYAGLGAGAAYVAGIRPEHLVLREGGLAARVTAVEPTGSETLIQAMAGEQAFNILVRDRVELSAGDAIELAAEPKRIHLFDPVTEAGIPSAAAPARSPETGRARPGGRIEPALARASQS